jgi:hypothetical protein
MNLQTQGALAAPAPSHRSTLLYWILVLIVIPGILLSVICTVDLVLHPIEPDYVFNSPIFRLVIGLVAAPISIVVALLIVRRDPGNVVGLFLALIGIACSMSAVRSGVNSPLVAVIVYTYGGLQWPALFLLMAYFPDGKIFFNSIRRLIDGFACFFLSSFTVSIFANKEFSLAPPIEGISLGRFTNPLYTSWTQPIWDSIRPIGQLGTVVLIVLGMLSLVFRYRAGNEHERLQIRWLTWCFGIFVILAVVGVAFNLFSTSTIISTFISIQTIYYMVFYSWLLIFPVVAVGNAILRHRLYDIDIIIRRTLIYSLLSGLLALVFFGGVTLVQAVFRSITGEGSDLAIVVSTLAIAALFNPLRRRVQNIIDRRFYRRKYNAEKTLEQFAALARDEVDVEKLKAAMVGAVQDTMQPRSVSVWVKDASGNR